MRELRVFANARYIHWDGRCSQPIFFQIPAKTPHSGLNVIRTKPLLPINFKNASSTRCIILEAASKKNPVSWR